MGVKKNKALFFDRDGVINVDTSYVYKKEDFQFYEDLFSCMEYFKKNNYQLVVITNQSGIQRGYYSILDFLHISKYMQDTIQERIKFCFDRIYYCPSLYDDERRKPAPGMIIQAQKDLNIDLCQSYLVGDKQSDVAAGLRAGISNVFLLDRFGNEKVKSKFYDNHEVKIIQNLTELRF